MAAVGAGVAYQGSVNLQASTPGSPQNGHSNISGTSKAGFFKGNGSLLTNLNGSEVKTGIITLTGSSPNYIIRASNSDGSSSATGLIGISSSLTGATYGGWFESKSNNGRALFGYASSTSGATYGTYAQNNSNAGRASFGLATSPTGNTYGGWFQSNSPDGVGSYARNTAGGIGLRAESSGTALEVLGRAIVSGFVGIGTAAPDWPLHIISAQNVLIKAEGTGTTGQTAIGAFSTLSDVGNALFAEARATTGSATGLRAQSSSPTGYGVLGRALSSTGANYGVYGESSSPSGYGVYGKVSSISGAGLGTNGRVYASGYVISDTGFSGDGSFVFNVDAETLDGFDYTDFYRYGNPLVADGTFSRPVEGITSSTSGRGVGGYATATSGTTTGVYGTTDSPNGRGMVASANATTGNSRGIIAQTSGPGGIAVEAKTFSTNGGNIAVSASAAGDSANAMRADATSTTGSTYGITAYTHSTTSQGILGYALANTGTSIGVQGATNSPSGYGVWFYGRLAGSGTKSFRIDHPFDPTNKYLLHYCSESPSPQNFYSGNAKTDGKGYAWVELPDYFGEINKNFKYQLTVVDDGDSTGFTMAKISQAIRNNRFQIRTSEPNVTVSWRVEADRNDLYVRNRPTSDIEMKLGREKGSYTHPEFYGQPEERGVLYQQMYGPKGADKPAPAQNKR